jgi:hypothetical protein
LALGLGAATLLSSGAAMAAPQPSQAERAEIARLGAPFADALAKDTADYRAELSQLGWFRFIADPSVIVGDKGLDRTRALVRQARAIMERYRALYPRRVAEERARIVQAGLGEDVRRAALADFERGVAKGRGQWDRLWARDAKFIDETGAIVSLLARDEGWWSVADGRIAFDNQADQRAFDAHAAALERIAVAEARSAGGR